MLDEINRQCKRLLKKVNKLDNEQVVWIFILVGLAVFFTGLHNPFQGDDSYQIVSNLPVHSIKNIGLFFRSSTFFNGQQLVGVYYRPLMSTTFSLIYTFFGPHTWAYHLVQLLLYISSAFLVFLIFKHFLKKQTLAIFLAMVFLVHPLNSQAVFSIPTMQDALFFFFGILALWLLITYQTTKGLLTAALCLLLSLLSKETAIVFIIVALLYLFWFDRKRILKFAGLMALTIVLYLALKINAVGLNAKQNGAPIDNLHLAGRLMTDPSIILFYITKFIFPWKLATGYYWTYPKFSISHVLLPLLIDLAVVGLFVYLAFRVKQKRSKVQFHAYLLFASLAIVGLLPYLQIIPLDMTACEDWFYPSMAGVLGMVGLASLTFKNRIQPLWLMVIAVVLIGALGVRTAIRGTDYRSQYILAVHDLSASPVDYSAMNNIAEGLTGQRNFNGAVTYAQQSANIYPTVSNYNNLGVALQDENNYAAAAKAYTQALKYGSLAEVYENLGLISFEHDNPATSIQFMHRALKVYPQDYKLWLYLALLEDAQGDNKDAKVAITKSADYGPAPQQLVSAITDNQPFTIELPGSNQPFVVR